MQSETLPGQPGKAAKEGTRTNGKKGASGETKVTNVISVRLHVGELSF